MKIFVMLLTLALATVSSAQEVKKADLSRIVCIGDSLMAGFQNGSLLDRQQVNGIGAVVSRQAGVELALPLIAEPGIPNVLQLVNPGPPPVVMPMSGASPGRADPLTQVTNLAVPGHTVADALARRPDLPFDSLTDPILGLPGMLGGVSKSQVEWAEALQPTTIIVWLGPNDTLGAALDADAAEVTDDVVFETAYTELMERLDATGAAIVVANIPDVTVIPYLTPAADVAALVGAPLEVIGPALGIAAGDYVTPSAYPLIGVILTGAQPGPLPANVVLDAGEVATIRAATARFNEIIAAQAAAHGAALVDIHALLNKWKMQGLVVGGQRLTTDFLGGIFSLDGFHPSNTAYAAAANEFIKALNRTFETDVPRANVRAISKTDPLVLPGVGHPASALDHIGDETVAALRAVMQH